MNNSTNEYITNGLKELLAARSTLEAAQKLLDKDVNRSAPGSAIEKLSLGLQRACNHISEAIADVPGPLWQLMLQDAGYTPEQIRRELAA